MIGKADVIFSCVPLCGRHFVYKGNIITIFHFEGKRPKSIVLIMNKAQEVAIIGPLFRSQHETLSKPVALFGDKLPN